MKRVHVHTCHPCRTGRSWFSLMIYSHFLRPNKILMVPLPRQMLDTNRAARSHLWPPGGARSFNAHPQIHQTFPGNSARHPQDMDFCSEKCRKWAKADWPKYPTFLATSNKSRLGYLHVEKLWSQSSCSTIRTTTYAILPRPYQNLQHSA